MYFDYVLWVTPRLFRVGIKRTIYKLITNAIVTKSVLPMKVGIMKMAEDPAAIADKKIDEIFILNGIPLPSK